MEFHLNLNWNKLAKNSKGKYSKTITFWRIPKGVLNPGKICELKKSVIILINTVSESNRIFHSFILGMDSQSLSRSKTKVLASKIARNMPNNKPGRYLSWKANKSVRNIPTLFRISNDFCEKFWFMKDWVERIL